MAFFAEYEINYFSKLPKSKKFLLLTRALLTMEAYVNFEGEKVLLLQSSSLTLVHKEYGLRSSKTLGEAFQMCCTQIFGVQLSIEDEVL